MIELPSSLAESGAYSPDRALLRPARLSATMPPASRRSSRPEGLQIWSSEEAHLVNTILNQPYRRRVSTDQLNREDRKLAVSLEEKSGPTPAGKTLPHSYHKTSLYFLKYFHNFLWFVSHLRPMSLSVPGYQSYLLQNFHPTCVHEGLEEAPPNPLSLFITAPPLPPLPQLLE